MSKTTIGDRIRVERCKKGISQDILSTKAGLSRVYINQLENNRSKYPSAKSVLNIARALGVSIYKLLEGDIKITTYKLYLNYGVEEYIEVEAGSLEDATTQGYEYIKHNVKHNTYNENVDLIVE